MIKKLCDQKFKRLWLTSTFAMLVSYLMLLTDTIIIGTILGETALSGVNLVTPLFPRLYFSVV